MNLSVIMFGVAAILAFDTVGSLASRHLGFAYSRLMLGSFAIYSAVGFGVSAGSLVPAALAGAIIGLVESTIGWAISWGIGPGRPPVENVALVTILRTVGFVTALGAVFGALGGWLRLIALRAAA